MSNTKDNWLMNRIFIEPAKARMPVTPQDLVEIGHAMRVEEFRIRADAADPLP